ncbi:hypothetical protein [Larkinella soli]|uniref:hypothetical protein n=1 Tax=Larkinella soli TaxID=1770527 RepID=UPI000FFBE462|nr:hypothetical protein [Larkinella soli]
MTNKILNRLGQSIPPNLSITPHTTPVAFFGDFDNASACTISINPSHCEFYNKTTILTGGKKRLISRKELNRHDSEELSQAEAKLVFDFCKNYFKTRPYKGWFNKYDEFLKLFGLSYYNGSTVHLDVVQWATTPLWSSLTETQRQILLKNDLPFLISLLEKDFNLIFLNGNTVVSALQDFLGIQLVKKVAFFKPNSQSHAFRFNIYLGNYNNSKVIGWSPYLQSKAIPSYEDARQFAQAIKDVVEAS